MHPADLLQASIERNRSVAVVGLDPRPALIPPALREEALGTFGDTAEAVAHAFARFNRGLLKAVAGACAAVKPQLACYEAYGAAGIRAYEDTVRAAREFAIPVLADGKRNDIGSTAEHYAQAFFGGAPGLSGAALAAPAPADWLTVNAYLGSDGILPFQSKPDHGIFVLVKTSNPSSGEIQDQRLADPRTGPAVSEAVARLVAGWGGNRLGASGLSSVGAVVGATYPEQARQLRELMPDTMFLVPGYGAQGGSAADALAGRRSDGRGVLVNSSRGIIAAWQRADTQRWDEAARGALDAMNADLARA
ncbi:orotidine 5'-phosphate decarboxylase [Planctomycetota bacterium]|nr:orotidine 5'-phosphate decarboxylase [Planctomycetota bacterium]